MRTRTLSILVGTILSAGGAAMAQSAADTHAGFDKPMSSRTRVAQPSVLQEHHQDAHAGVHQDGQTSTTMIITKTDESGTYMVKVSGDDLSASVNGKELPGKQIDRSGERVRLLNAEGEVVAEFQLAGQGGNWLAGGVSGRGMRWRTPEPDQDGQFFGDADIAVTDDTTPPVMLGITMGEPSETLLEHLGLDKGGAVLIDRVYEGLPAAEAGMQDADILVMLDGQSPLDEVKVRKILRTKEPGEAVKAVVVRKGEKKELKIKLRAYDAEKLGGLASGAGGFSPQDLQTFGWRQPTVQDPREAIEKALRSLQADGRLNSEEARDAATKALKEALAGLKASGVYELSVVPRVYSGGGQADGEGGIVFGPGPGQVFNIPPTPAPPAARNGELSRQMDDLRAQLREVQRSRDELKAQLDDIQSMLRDMRDSRDRR